MPNLKPGVMMKKLRRSQWFDSLKSDYAHCVNKPLTEEDFLKGLVLDYFIKSRGVSRLSAAGHAIKWMIDEYKRISDEVSEQRLKDIDAAMYHLPLPLLRAMATASRLLHQESWRHQSIVDE
jgi:hypothetical protein